MISDPVLSEEKMTVDDFNRNIALDKRQWDRFQEWAKRRPRLKEALEEDCCCASPFVFHIYTTGLGPNITVTYGKQKLDLTIGDDGEWVHP
jgi:hypothetical protein